MAVILWMAVIRWQGGSGGNDIMPVIHGDMVAVVLAVSGGSRIGYGNVQPQ
jgi:hypothetical protein